MEKMSNYTVIQISKDTWIIQEEIVRMFVLKGTDRALLIDCGMMIPNAKEVAEELTAQSVSLALTHADRDHIAGLKDFETFYMHPAEEDNLHMQGEDGSFIAVEEGSVIDLGGRKLEIIEIPGHTPGSIGYLDLENRVLISGDPVQDGEIFLFGPQRDFNLYMTSLLKLETEKDRFDMIFPAHGTFPLPTDMIMDLYEEAKRIKMGKGEWVEAEMFGVPIRRYETSKGTFLLDAK